jgi:AraC-like DNA-binding protein
MRLVEDWLLDTCVTGRNVHPLVHWAMHRIADSRGQVRAEQLARDAGCSRKHLTGVFARQVGLPPKSLAQITRFQHAMQRLRRDGPVDWCEVAFECGYYDQSHLIREFHRYSGMAPGAFARAGKPDPGSVVVR